MGELWKLAFGIAGLGAIASFLLWSLYREWLRLSIFQRLTKQQQFSLFRLFLVLTFLFALASVLAYVVVQLWQPPVVHSGRTSDTEPSPIAASDRELAKSTRLQLVDVHLHSREPDLEHEATQRVERNDQWAEFPIMDVKIRNPGEEVAFLTHLRVGIERIWFLRRGPHLSAAAHFDPTATYDVVLPLRFPTTVVVPISQEVEPNKVDRFLIKLHLADTPESTILETRAAADKTIDGLSVLRPADNVTHEKLAPYGVDGQTAMHVPLHLALVFAITLEIDYNAAHVLTSDRILFVTLAPHAGLGGIGYLDNHWILDELANLRGIRSDEFDALLKDAADGTLD